MKKYFRLGLILLSSFLLSACKSSSSTKDVEFSHDEELVEEITPYVDELANHPTSISKQINLNQEFSVDFQTKNPDGLGKAYFKAKSIKTISAAGQKTPNENQKLILVEISVKGDPQNRGTPSTFNQVGSRPSPQFVLIDPDKNQTWVEETYYSDGYTQANNLFELSKITLDQSQWVHTAIVFQIDQNQQPNLAFRFINPQGQVEFYDIQE